MLESRESMLFKAMKPGDRLCFRCGTIRSTDICPMCHPVEARLAGLMADLTAVLQRVAEQMEKSGK